MMLIPFLLGLFGMLMVAFALYRYALRVNRDAIEVEELKELLEEQDAAVTRAAAEDALERLHVKAAAVMTAGTGAAASGGPASTDDAAPIHSPKEG